MEVQVFPLVGFLVGILTGLTSMGGAALMAPFLILIAGVRPTIAVGTDLAYGAITKVVGACMHWREGTVDLGVVRRLALGSVPGGLLGAVAVGQLHRYGWQADDYVRRAIGVVLILVALILITRYVGGRRFRLPKRHLSRLQGLGTVAWAAIVGFTVGVTSVGSGTLIVPFLLAVYSLSPAKVVGTDVFHAAILVSASAATHLSIGTVDWSLASLLLAGSVPGVLLGSYLAPRVPAPALRMGLGAVLLASGIKLV